MPHPKERRLLLSHADEPGYTGSYEDYTARGGYRTLQASVRRKPAEIKKEVLDANIRGRGGALFPAGRKWGFLDPNSDKPVYLICNADESEPGTFKDRQLIHKDPHQLIEGMMISAYAIGAKIAFIYIRGEMFGGARILEEAIEKARENNLVGENILGCGYSCDLIVHRGAGSYICGEETGLIESLEGKRPYPRLKPPFFPAAKGLYMCPTIVNNVETLCQVKHAVELGGQEYAKIGVPNCTGTRIWSLSGHVRNPGYFEVEGGAYTFGDLIYDMGGGLREGRSLLGFIPGGSSTKVIKHDQRYRGKLQDGTEVDWGVEDIPLDCDGCGYFGSSSGSAAVMVMDDTTDVVMALANLNAFYAHESCGQCTPCREGSLWLKKITHRMIAGEAREEDADLLKSIADQVEGRTICAHGEAVAWPVQGFILRFKDEFVEYARRQARERAARAQETTAAVA
mgnify:FL=1|jgi:NADH-quinone oxidoreductase subunit F